ncbi:metal-dependent hydrolase [Methylovirgula sp. 4M-Z18]|uniref:metal-dependent hydrolase n=1 Tax=Methylovirgula sp. 4M-Z18 TaxID=2293567 RepID=UPI000E2FB933|nr:metal-dependent hydrolase [Methylovirgula sp. 4M-Z18]RFB80660.1 metal-dependent hydrolase [Methylovirgula sp. 4M-Z18]
MKLTWLGHSAVRLDIGKSVILIDPFLTGNPSFKGDAQAMTQDATHIILTHGHDDHLGDASEIAQRTGAQVISNFEICMFLNSEGVQNINPGNTGGTIPCGDFSVSFTQALHSSGITRDGKSIYLGNPNGMVIKHPDAPVIYHMGDTDIFGDMALIQEIHQPKLAFVPIGDRFTMNAKTAALACKRFFSFDHVVPVHYATFPGFLAPNADEFVAAMSGSNTKVLVARVGEGLSL